MTPKIQQAAMALTRARSVIALTGAGISVESGIPPFRGKGGLWEKIDPMAYAHIDAYERDPEQAWKVLYGGLKEVLDRAKPNNGHLGLSQLESMGFVKTIITQNIDGLHQQSGSNDVIEFHGTFASHHCMACGQGAASNSINCEPPPPRCACGGLLRPDVVMFGELIPPEHLQRGQMLASTCDLMLVVGTSATVEPAAHLPVIAKRAGATIIEINPETTPLSDHVSDITLLGKAGRVMGELVASVGRNGWICNGCRVNQNSPSVVMKDKHAQSVLIFSEQTGQFFHQRQIDIHGIDVELTLQGGPQSIRIRSVIMQGRFRQIDARRPTQTI